MSFYVVCYKKRNNPRMDVRICQKKCSEKDDCEEYLSFHKVAVQDKENLPPIESRSMQLEVA
ncbi:MAG: hypothetical protein JRC68_04340 [Deltaproteobacteria bacterium]|nr:hypothetical protein [Deltaproteobacteria bacterium]